MDMKLVTLKFPIFMHLEKGEKNTANYISEMCLCLANHAVLFRSGRPIFIASRLNRRLERRPLHGE